MKLIELSQGRVAVVDDEDFKWLSKWNWYYHRLKQRNTGYAVRGDYSKSQKQRVSMQITIMEHYKCWRHGKEVDHINTCGCDNRKENLRFATLSQQNANKRQQSNNTSGVVGVNWCEAAGKWIARIGINGKRKYLGVFVNKKDAIAARRQAEIKYFGEYRYDPKKLCPLWKTGQCPDCAKRAKELGLKP